MQYLMFVATDPDAEPYAEADDNIEEWVADAKRSGLMVMGNRLRPPEDATTVRVRGGELLITDGPFTEGREWVAGFDVLEADNLDEVIELVSRHPMARFGQLEIRPFWPLRF